jgi:hypothetical protein
VAIILALQHLQNSSTQPRITVLQFCRHSRCCDNSCCRTTSLSSSSRCLGQGCQIFLSTTYQNGRNVPNYHILYQTTIKCTKVP